MLAMMLMIGVPVIGMLVIVVLSQTTVNRNGGMYVMDRDSQR